MLCIQPPHTFSGEIPLCLNQWVWLLIRKIHKTFPVFPDFLDILWCIYYTFLSLTTGPNNFNLKVLPLKT